MEFLKQLSLHPLFIAVVSAIITVLIKDFFKWWKYYRENYANKSPYFRELHHVSVSVDNLDIAIAFYTDILKLTQIHRPGLFPFKGAWYALPDGKQLHLVENVVDAERNAAVLDDIGGKKILSSTAEKKIFELYPPPIDRIINGHFALRVRKKTDYDYIKNLAEQRGFETSDKNFQGLEQLYILDPSKNIIEISYFKNDFMRSRPLNS